MQVGSLPQDSDPLLRLGLALKLDRVLDLGKLVVDKRVVAVAVAVVLDQEVKRLFLAALAEQESRGVGHEVCRHEKVYSRTDLENVWKTPLPRGGEIATTKVDPRVDDRAKDPVRIPRVGDGRSASWVGDFLNHDKRGHEEGSETETDDQSARDEQAEAVPAGQTGEGADDRAEQDGVAVDCGSGKILPTRCAAYT